MAILLRQRRGEPSNATSIVQRRNAINTPSARSSVLASALAESSIAALRSTTDCRSRQTKIKHSIQRSSAITFANTSAWGA